MPDSGAGVLAESLRRHLDHQVGKSVHHLGLIAEIFGGIDHAEHLDDALDAIERAERGAPSMRRGIL
jgi:hypothetical protein